MTVRVERLVVGKDVITNEIVASLRVEFPDVRWGRMVWEDAATGERAGDGAKLIVGQDAEGWFARWTNQRDIRQFRGASLQDAIRAILAPHQCTDPVGVCPVCEPSLLSVPVTHEDWVQRLRTAFPTFTWERRPDADCYVGVEEQEPKRYVQAWFHGRVNRAELYQRGKPRAEGRGPTPVDAVRQAMGAR